MLGDLSYMSSKISSWSTLAGVCLASDFNNNLNNLYFKLHELFNEAGLKASDPARLA